MYENVSKSFRSESIKKCTLAFGITRSKITQRVMTAKLARLTHKNSDTTAPSGRELYHLLFPIQAANPETFGNTLVLLYYKYICMYVCICETVKSRDCSVGIANDYGLHVRMIGVRIPAGAGIFFPSTPCPDRLWGPPSLLVNRYRGLFPLG
jgi:hypothetical protein